MSPESAATVDEETHAEAPSCNSNDVWATVAPGWATWLDQLSSAMTPVRTWMVNMLGAQPGATLLDLGAGFGDTGFDASPAIGPNGRLITSDLSRAMLEIARRRGQQRGIRNAEFRIIDAQQIPLPDDEVDGVLCMNAYMVVPNVSLALAETRRVLRRGGRLSMAVWGRPDCNPWASVPGKILVDHGHIPPPKSEAPGITNLSDAADTTTMLHEAGFSNVRTAGVDIHFSFDSIEDFDRWFADVAGGLALPVRGLSNTNRKAFRAEIEEAFEPYRTDRGYKVPGATLCAAAT